MKKQRKQALTEKQASFAFEYINNGRNATKAYRTVYNTKKDASQQMVWKNAHEVLYNSKVAVRVNELQMQTYDGDIMSLNERKLMLTSLARVGDKQAVDMLNKMDGTYIEKKEIHISGQIIIGLPDKKPLVIQ